MTDELHQKARETLLKLMGAGDANVALEAAKFVLSLPDPPVAKGKAAA